jgi:hypothetical protein
MTKKPVLASQVELKIRPAPAYLQIGDAGGTFVMFSEGRVTCR